MRVLAGAVTALRRLVDLVLVALIVIVLLGLVLGKVLPLMGRQTIVVGGGSMEPAIQLGSAIVIRPVPAEALAVGDVVSMQIGPQLTVFTHRIMAITDRSDGPWIRTQGDANAEPDPTMVPATAVMGRVDVVIPYAGYLLALLSLPIGVMFILGLAAALLGIAWLLESVETERPSIVITESPARRLGLAGHESFSALTAATVTHIDDFLRGEPIAARPAPSAYPTHPPTLASTAGPASRTWPDAGRRSPVRSHLERSREVRARRASWLRGGRGPID